jgi:hypothetical protein
MQFYSTLLSAGLLLVALVCIQDNFGNLLTNYFSASSSSQSSIQVAQDSSLLLHRGSGR